MTEAEFLDKLTRLVTAQIRLFEQMTGRSLGLKVQIVRKDDGHGAQ